VIVSTVGEEVHEGVTVTVNDSVSRVGVTVIVLVLYSVIGVVVHEGMVVTS